MFQNQIAKIGEKAKEAMIKALDEFRELACSIDCPATEGPVIDAFTCNLIMEEHCYGGEACGDKTYYEAERRDIIIFIAVLGTFAILVCSFLCFTIFHYCQKIKACTEMCNGADIELGGTKSKGTEDNGGEKGITTLENESETEKSQSQKTEESESDESEDNSSESNT
ncbi:izumo sperm-egg fusion protein 3-like [Xenopus laevis]|uniref:Izumo sperm-egg fusion protein 3-like n=1 Tax=Xenopus laevis TaxID=8355 RepID=A0A8J1LW58_XENLA|nr:izumo sperm-egg fusion protein 3-like [Xenopus laevis]XP_041433281.1 izumo sperm-egg fusion protein 3-like [Xenopus laevis]XP_041433290.1 izumo sperm-egg fusion protein 3-like [Xenopus laevis]XP_041433303.1 izumo sperm-egg fusion protein 3-like [Xenopus laevis]XP_041433305.1 izumo sperm-egg fusion protein 3-like [Xenopus laevis]XP_041433306.1 izumo sperm-egg fusion protein 3-like [Xenopus laevis]